MTNVRHIRPITRTQVRVLDWLTGRRDGEWPTRGLPRTFNPRTLRYLDEAGYVDLFVRDDGTDRTELIAISESGRHIVEAYRLGKRHPL